MVRPPRLVVLYIAAVTLQRGHRLTVEMEDRESRLIVFRIMLA
jgi:hypothetical protein